MRGYRWLTASVVLSLCAAGAAATAAAAAPTPTVAANPRPSPEAVPLAKLPSPLREEIRTVIERPTISAQGPGEVFTCKPEQYYWFLDHPDRAVTAWRRLGAKCVSINAQGNGLFAWTDDAGSAVTWQTVYSDGEKRVWYAWGKVRPGPLLPLVPVRVVLVLHHKERPGANGGMMIHHYSDMFVHTDSKTAALVTKMLGAQGPRMAEQGLGQLQMFFSALSYYCDRNPRSAKALIQAE